MRAAGRGALGAVHTESGEWDGEAPKGDEAGWTDKHKV
jgi:hypothetical protein